MQGIERLKLFSGYLIGAVSTLTTEKVYTFLANAPRNYYSWWIQMYNNAPEHVIIETTLILFVLWLLFIRRTVDPRKTNKPEKLSAKEVEWLLETWRPEPLVPPLNPVEQSILENAVVIEEMEGDYLIIRGIDRPVLNVGNFDFLCLGQNEDIKQKAKDALDFYGCGSCGPRGFYGTIDQHLILEQEIARFMDTQEAICYSDGSSAVSSAIPAFCKKGDLIFVDESCSEPILTGANLSRSTVRFFRHNDMVDLRSKLEAVRDEDRRLKRDAMQQRRFIVVEGVYRNTGDIVPLQELVKLKEEFFYRVILDETFSFGTLGATGRGVTEHFGMKSTDIEVITFTLDTSLASVGGICVGTREIVDHQRLSGAGYCFSASSAPFLCSAAIEALKIMEKNPSVIEKLQENVAKVHERLRSIPGLKVVSSDETAVIHLVLDETESRGFDIDSEAIRLIARECLNNGVGVVASNFALLRVGQDLQPSIMLTINVNLDDAKIASIVQVLTAAVNNVL